MFKTTATILADADEKGKIEIMAKFLDIKFRHRSTEDPSFICMRLRAKKKDLFLFFHQAGRLTKSVIVYY